MLTKTELQAIESLYTHSFREKLVRVYGPYIRHSDGRTIVVIHYGKHHTTKLLAKVRLEVKLGRILGRDETVDHIDEDITNDDPDNLQLLSREDNASKSARRLLLNTAFCVWCNYEFVLTRRQYESSNNHKAGPFCSRECRGEYGYAIQRGILEKMERLTLNKVYSR